MKIGIRERGPALRNLAEGQTFEPQISTAMRRLEQ